MQSPLNQIMERSPDEIFMGGVWLAVTLLQPLLMLVAIHVVWQLLLFAAKSLVAKGRASWHRRRHV